MSNYTVQADAKVNEKQAGGRRYVPSASVLNSRYVLILDGIEPAPADPRLAERPAG